MSSPVISVEQDTTVREAATLLRSHDIGALAVADQGQIIGVVTDRDMVFAVLTKPRNSSDLPVSEAMSAAPVTCIDSQSVAYAAALMGDAQVARLFIVDRLDRLVGVLTVGDIAVNASEVLAGEAVGEICEDRSVDVRARRITAPE
jgi:CBS domain-containing protein